MASGWMCFPLKLPNGKQLGWFFKRFFLGLLIGFVSHRAGHSRAQTYTPR